DVVSPAKGHAVHAEFAESTERNYLKLASRHRGHLMLTERQLPATSCRLPAARVEPQRHGNTEVQKKVFSCGRLPKRFPMAVPYQTRLPILRPRPSPGNCR